MLGCKNHWHAVVNVCDQCIRIRRDDAAGVDRRFAFRFPVIPEPGKGERLSLAQADEMRLFGRAGFFPFIETVRGDQAAAALEGFAVGGFAGERVGARVDHRIFGVGAFGPERNQAPVQQAQAARAVGRDAGGEDVLAGRDIVGG